MVDLSTDTVLLDRNGGEAMHPSSMTKIMTMYVVLEKIRAGELSLNDTLPVSKKAWAMQGSKTWVPVGEKVRVEDLVRGVIVQSGNDATLVLAEGIAGSEEAFVDMMNRKAVDMGLTQTHFTNTTGWPDPQHYSSAHDLAVMAARLMKDFPEHYHYYSEREFTFNGIKQGNRNPLLYRNMGADGIKTGHTEAGGFGMVASVVRNDRRLLLVINGLSDMQVRADETARLVEWGFSTFMPVRLAQKGRTYATVPVVYGTQDTVTLTAGRDLAQSLDASGRKGISIKAVYSSPLKAPLKAGDNAGKLVVTIPGQDASREVPLVVAADVPETGFWDRLKENIGMVFSRTDP